MYDDEGPSTLAELVREQMYYDGQFCPEKAWILSDFDTWERNPHYNGPPNPPHPEDPPEEEGAEVVEVEPPKPPAPPVPDWEIPF